MESITRYAHCEREDNLSLLVGALLMFEDRARSLYFVRKVTTIRFKFKTKDGRKSGLFAAYNMLILNQWNLFRYVEIPEM